MDEYKMQDLLENALWGMGEIVLEDEERIRSIRSFEEVMLLTSNKGLVVQLVDGSEFQVTIVQTK